MINKRSPRFLFGSTHGFTLVELMVVISIIGILSAIVYNNFANSRAQARNSTMQTALKETQLALELYKAQNGHYPSIVGSPCLDGKRTTSKKSTGCEDNYIPELSPQYIEKLPNHLLSQNTVCRLDYVPNTHTGDPSSYKLQARNCVEGTVPVTKSNRFYRCAASCTDVPCLEEGEPGADTDDAALNIASYAVYSLGMQCWPGSSDNDEV